MFFDYITLVIDLERLPPPHNGITEENAPAFPPATIIVNASGPRATLVNFVSLATPPCEADGAYEP